jgi:hypothetical protein
MTHEELEEAVPLYAAGALDRAAWQPLLEPFVPPVPLEQSHGGPAGRPTWAPDGRHLWLPDQVIVDAAGGKAVTVERPSPWAVWKPDGSALVTSAAPGATLLRLVALDGTGRDFWAPEWSQPVGFLPDGRVLVFQANIP